MSVMGLKSPTSPLLAQLLIQAKIKENIKAPCHWLLWEEFLTQKANNAENVFIWWRHYVDAKMCLYISCHADSHVYTEIF